MSKMHEQEIVSDEAQVSRLLASQFPEWAELPIARIETTGTVNALYRLGDDLVARLPRTDWAKGAIDRQLGWLPHIAPAVRVEVPMPLAKGVPGEGFPSAWGVYPWLEGENPVENQLSDAEGMAKDLAGFIRALHALDLPGGPPAGRGATLKRWDEPARAALVELEGVIDTDAARAAWEISLTAPEWPGPPAWIHGDVMPGNLLVRDGRLSAVIDWEAFGTGDPATDLMVAWNLLPAEARAVFRAELEVDDDTWARGRRWALWTGLLALPYYKETNPIFAENARYRIGEVLADVSSA